MKRILFGFLFVALLSACQPTPDNYIYNAQQDIKAELELTIGEDRVDFLSYDDALIEETDSGYRVIGLVFVDTDELQHESYQYHAILNQRGSLETFTLNQNEVID